MKQLTTAYRDGDLHTMLRLEVEWTVREQANPSRLTNAKLAIFNRVLKEQTLELQQTLQTMEYEPRYETLHRYSTGFGKSVTSAGEEIRRFLQHELEQLKRSVQALQSANPEAELLAIARD
jgi:hypothetical protein